jgi:hypothetical protein
MSLIKVDKRTASKEYNKGNTIHLLPSKAVPGSIWITPVSINKQCGKSFDALINEYSYYNCSKETGLRINYYIDK